LVLKRLEKESKNTTGLGWSSSAAPVEQESKNTTGLGWSSSAAPVEQESKNTAGLQKLRYSGDAVCSLLHSFLEQVSFLFCSLQLETFRGKETENDATAVLPPLLQRWTPDAQKKAKA
jgi:hypothetical protein